MKRINHKALLFYVVFSTGVTLQCVAQFGGGPVTTPTINPISGQGPYCTNENSIFTVTLPQGCTFINWRFVGGTIEYFNGSSASTQSITARFSANGTLYAQCSCGETSKPITVVSPPSVSASANPETVTAGSQVTLTASGTAATYSWTGNGLVQTTGATVTAIPPEGENYYTATGTSATEGCYNQSTVKVTATAAPLDAGPDRTYCRDAGPVDLTSWGLNLSAGSWSGPTGSISNGFVILANLSTGTHTFTYTRTADGKSDGILLTVIQTEEGHISPNITSNCEVASGSLTLQAYDGTIQFWEKSTDDGINWLKVSSATGGFETAPTINFSVSAETWFRASVKKDVCAVSFTDHVEVVPKNPFGGSISFTEIYQTCGQAKGIIRHDNGRGDTFTWEENTGSGWVPITGATNPYSFDVSSSRTFRVRAETSGCATKYTNELSVYTNSVAGRVRTSSGSTAVCGSFNGNLLLVGTNIGTVTKWQYSTDNSNWSDIASSSGKTVLSYTASEPVNYFRVFVTLDDCAPAVTPAFRLNVDPPTKPGAVTMALEKYPSETINGVLTFYPQFQLSGYRGTIQNWWQETETERTEIDVQTNVLDAVVTETTGFSAQVKNGVCDPLVSGRAIFFVNKAFLGVQQLVLGSSLSAYEGYSYIIKTGDGLELRDGFSFQANSGQQFFVLLDGNYSTPPSDHNYVMQEAVTVDGIKNDGDIYFLNASQKTSSISYFDGLGKLIQQVERRMSPTEKDVVTPMTYDDFGRNVVSFLSFTDEETSGYFKEDAVTKQRDFYLNPPPKIAATDYPFSVSVLEKSPVNRLLEQGSPGTEWQPDLGHTVKYEYQANDGESVKLWRVNENGMPVFVDEAGVSQFYKEGTLIVNVTQDEDGGRIRQYMDEFGRVVLKQVQLDDEWLETYYVYDKFGLLRYVIQPEGSARLTGNPDADFLHKWTFQYEYDQKGRAVVKKVAGGAPLFLVYDNRDRVVLLQDGNQRERNEWTFNKYDAFNRVVISGIYKHDGTGIISREDISALISADS
ncbi:MAG TPA: DUF6443 domain-containing protein, partial [Chryseosolibacter sp.]|nr:DUF6443 domain-containing protein [Chryseosolibacter sp.]